MMPKTKQIERIGAVAVGALAAAALLAGLYSAYCAYTNFKFYFDYAAYTNMLYNSAYGQWFRMFVDSTYVKRHLSFTLLLLAPFFRAVRHPWLLGMLQWGLVAGGACFTAVLGRRLRPLYAAALVLLLAGHRFTQSMLVYEFHGVALYYVLLPWLYYTLTYARRWTALPLILLLGVREDAFLMALPMLAVSALQTRKRRDWIYAAAALIYGILAITAIYPALNDGLSLFARRAGYMETPLSGLLSGGDWEARLYGWSMALIPMAMIAGRHVYPVLVYPAFQMLCLLMASYPQQRALTHHYGAPLIVLVTLGILETERLRAEKSAPRAGRTQTLRAVLLVVFVLAAHVHSGFLPGGGKNYDCYRRIGERGRHVLRIVDKLPREGLLATDMHLASFCAHRLDFMRWDEFKPGISPPLDIAFTESRLMDDVEGGRVFTLLRSNEFGVAYHDGEYAIAARGADPSGNEAFMKTHAMGPLLFCFMPRHGGRDVWVRTAQSERIRCRHWEGDGSRAPINIAYGGERYLGTGVYDAVFRFRAETPARDVRGWWGRLSIHRFNEPTAIAEKDIAPVPDAKGVFRTERLRFRIEEPVNAEVHVTGGDAPLWIHSVVYEPVEE